MQQWLEGIVTTLRKLQFDSSRFENRIPALLKQFRSAPRMIVSKWVEPAKPKLARLPKWQIPQDHTRRVKAAGGAWEEERYDPILLTVNNDGGYQGRAIPLMWQVEFDPGDERLEAARGGAGRRWLEQRHPKSLPQTISEAGRGIA